MIKLLPMPNVAKVVDVNELRDREVIIQDCAEQQGEQLQIIRNKRLYKETYKTFELYCQKRWGWGRHYVNRLIKHAQAVKNLEPMGTKPTHEKQTRPLNKVLPELQKPAWAKAVADAGGKQPTEAQVKKSIEPFVLQSRKEQPKPQPLKPFVFRARKQPRHIMLVLAREIVKWGALDLVDRKHPSNRSDTFIAEHVNEAAEMLLHYIESQEKKTNAKN